MRLFVFGLGYSASRIAALVTARGGTVVGTGRAGMPFDDEKRVQAELKRATHVLSSVPPDDEDPVLQRYGDALGRAEWLGYLSSTGVYGDVGGAWVDEHAPVRGRRAARNRADQRWLGLHACVFRLPGIYGPGRSPLDRVRDGMAHRTGIAGQVFSRIHVDDLAAGVVAGFSAPAGAYNLADDLPAPQDDVVAYAAHLLGSPLPRLVAVDQLSEAARAFYQENRRVATVKAKRLLGWRPRYPDYRAGLRALNAIASPAAVSSAPAAASPVQR